MDRQSQDQDVGGVQMKRRPTPEQGRALEVIGHAIEYLIDFYIVVYSEYGSRADTEAVQILVKLSMEVYEECAEVVPLHQRVRGWIRGYLLPE